MENYCHFQTLVHNESVLIRPFLQTICLPYFYWVHISSSLTYNISVSWDFSGHDSIEGIKNVKKQAEGAEQQRPLWGNKNITMRWSHRHTEDIKTEVPPTAGTVGSLKRNSPIV